MKANPPKLGAKRGRSTSGPCQHRDRRGIESCTNGTTEGKKMCIEHIAEMPYVAGILSGENKRADQRA